MRNVFYFSYLILLIFILSYCKKNDTTNSNKSDPVSADSILDNLIIDSESLFVYNKFIQLETNDDCLIGDVEQVLFLDNQNMMFILDSGNNSALLFDMNGKFIRRIGKIGHGPKELGNFTRIAISDSLLAIYSNLSNKIAFYSLNGEYIKELSFSKSNLYFCTSSLAIIGTDIYLYNNDMFCALGPDNKTYRIIKFSNYSDYECGYVANEKSLSFGDGFLVDYSNLLLYNGIFDGNIYSINKSDCNEVEIYSSIGELFDIKKIKEKENINNFIINNIRNKEFNFVRVFGRVYNFLIVIDKHANVSIIDNKGKVILKNWKLDNSIYPKNFNPDMTSLRTGFQTYPQGIFTVINDESTINTESELLNPGILLFKLNLN